MKKLLYVLSFIASIHSIAAMSAGNLPETSAVDSKSCKLFSHRTHPFILIINKGENLLDAITDCADAANIGAAHVSGLGAVENPTLAYYDSTAKQYEYKTFPGTYELALLNGNLTQSEGKSFAHLHIIMGDKKYNVVAGHLKNAQVSSSAEITIIPLEAPIIRKFDPNTGLNLITVKQ